MSAQEAGPAPPQQQPDDFPERPSLRELLARPDCLLDAATRQALTAILDSTEAPEYNDLLLLLHIAYNVLLLHVTRLKSVPVKERRTVVLKPIIYVLDYVDHLRRHVALLRQRMTEAVAAHRKKAVGKRAAARLLEKAKVAADASAVKEWAEPEATRGILLLAAEGVRLDESVLVPQPPAPPLTAEQRDQIVASHRARMRAPHALQPERIAVPRAGFARLLMMQMRHHRLTEAREAFLAAHGTPEYEEKLRKFVVEIADDNEFRGGHAPLPWPNVPAILCSSCEGSRFLSISEFSRHLWENGGITHGRPLFRVFAC